MTLRRVLGGAALTAGFGAACVAYGTFVESAAYRVRRYRVAVLEPGSAPLRVLHVSDIHLLPWQTRRRQFLASLAGLEPDLVISTGDSLSSPDAAEPLREALGRLLHVPGAFVLGSNDFTRPNRVNPLKYLHSSSASSAPTSTMRTAELVGVLSSGGWLDVDDARGVLDVRGQRLEFRGTGDAHESRDHYAKVAGPPEPGTVPLGVTHAPYGRVLDAMARDGVRLVFAGHTHGGQVCVPGYGALTTNCDLPTENAKGLFRHTTPDGESCWVHVSAGVGMSPYAPFRFACPPEVSLLTLTARSE